MDILNDLNQEQKKAVTYDKGPLLVIAGAGTGKTAVITRRLAWLIAQKKILPSEILALTFTDKAASEMEERVLELVPYGFVDLWVSTFHAFGDRILREEAFHLGLPRDFKVLTKPEQAIFLKDHFEAFNFKHLSSLSNPHRYIDDILTFFSRLKDEDIGPEQYLKYVQSQKGKTKGKEEKKEWEKQFELAQAYQKYQELMLETGNLDFGDQIVLLLKLFRENPLILKKYQNQFKYILVDEFQDTNFAQNELLKLLSKKDQNITVVADDDQSIYRFRGASFSNVLDFQKNFPKSRIIVLTQNYRSGQGILDASYKLIQHNNPDRLEVQNKIKKRLKAIRKGENPTYLFADKFTSEADQVARIIQEKLKKGYRYNDFAILIRKNNQASPFQKALSFYDIPYKFSGSSGLFNQPEIKLLISFLRVLTNPFDSLNYFHLLTSEVYDFPVQDAIKINAKAKLINKPLSEVCLLSDLEITDISQKILGNFCKDLEKFQEKSKKLTVGQLLYSFLKDSQFLEKLLKESETDIAAEVKIQNIAKFFEKIGEFEFISYDKSVFNFINHLEVLMAAGEDPALAELDPSLDAVNILTVHKAKGLEFRIVFLVNLVYGTFPLQKRGDTFNIPEGLIKETLPKGDWHLQEERRLFYVGCTRAKEELYLTFAQDYGGKRLRKTSQFVLEALDRPKIESSKIKLDSRERIHQFALKERKSLNSPRFWENGRMLSLTPHQIDDYLTCPKKFEYIHVLKVPIMKYHPIVYGAAIHKAIEEYFCRKINNLPVTQEDLLKAFERAWVSEGFITREHEEKRFQKGKKTLKKFFEEQEKKNLFPQKVEEPFNFYLPVPQADLPRRQAGLPDLKVKINGRYDAVYYKKSKIKNQKSKVKDSLIQEIEIRDFKTSEVDDPQKALIQVKLNRPLSVYALSYHLNHKIIPVVSLYFVETGILAKRELQEKDLEKTIQEIEKVTTGLRENNFSATPGLKECSFCPYQNICPYAFR